MTREQPKVLSRGGRGLPRGLKGVWKHLSGKSIGRLMRKLTGHSILFPLLVKRESGHEEFEMVSTGGGPVGQSTSRTKSSGPRPGL